jgi:signal transduction histidine kinase
VQRRTIDELQQVATMKDDFIAVASHELRTPLTALRGWVRPLDDDRLSPEQRARAVEKISRGVDRLAALVEDLLAVSLIDGGRSNPAAESIDLRALLDDVVAEVDPHDGQHRIVVSVPPELGPVAADRSFLRRVLVNLIGNGVKYSPGGGVVSIVASSVTGEIPMAQVSISDEGMGVPEGELDRLFAKFERCSNTRGTSGTGLGLYVVRGLVEAMGGAVTVTSVEGEGSRFSFTLPLVWRAERPSDRPSREADGSLETTGESRQSS